MRIAYIASRYPALSHTFIGREVDGLRAVGVEIDTFSVRPSETAAMASAAARREVATTTTILPLEPSRGLRAHGTAFLRSPGGYLRTLRRVLATSPGGVRNLLWRLFYFVEGIVLWWHCQRLGVSHVHAHFANVGSDLARVAAWFGTAADPGAPWRWSFTMHGSGEFYDVTHFGLAEKAADADAVICVSDYTRSQMMRLTDPSHWDRFHIVHCGIDPEEFQPPPEREDDGVLSVLTVGRLVSDKGLPVLVDAIDLLRRRGVPVELTVLGDGPLMASMRQDLGRRGLEDCVHLPGAVPSDEVVDHYQRADAFCLPSFAEGVPVVLMEAMACELPVVATEITGVPELVEEGVSGYLVTPGRSDLLAERLGCLTDPALRRRMGAAGRSRVRSSFDIAKVGPELRDAFATIVAGP